MAAQSESGGARPGSPEVGPGAVRGTGDEGSRASAARPSQERSGVGAGEESWGEVAPDAARRLLVGAVEAFAERGFHATTTRDIAGRAGMSPAALYIHFRTKEELLYQISRVGHERAVRILTEATEGPGDCADRLAAAVRSFVLWHAERHTTARVVQYELTALGPEHYEEIVALRRRSEELVRGLLESGLAAGEFAVRDVRGTAVAVLSLCIDVARWYQPDSRRTPEEIGALYGELVLRMVGVEASHPAVDPS